ncbi:MAG: OmpA family protein [Flavobacteriales bacterium]
MLRSITLSVLTTVTVLARAQSLDIPFDNEHFTDAQGLKAALAAIKQGDAAFRQGGRGFAEALASYGRAYAFNPGNAELDLKMGLCHLNGPHREQGLPFFQQVLRLAPETPRIHFYLGYSYQLNARWDEAIAEFQQQRAITTLTPDPDRAYNLADKHISECRNGKSFQSRPGRALVTPLGEGVNSDVADYAALVQPDGQRLYFTSRRSSGTGGKVNKATNEYFEDVYVCTATAGGWSAPVPMAVPVNSPLNDASVGLFNGGTTLLIYRDAKGAGDLYETTCTDGVWSDPKPLGPNVNSPANETSAWFSSDRKWLYFVSDREGGLGGQDIYRSAWVEATNEWGPADNLGPAINTMYDEDGVFVPGDGSTIYFSSQGHSSMGGADIFKSTNSNNTWSRPENLGWPINSPDDDQFFTLSADGRTGYLSSGRAGGRGEDDIYQVDMEPAAKPDGADLLVSAAGGAPVPEAAEERLTLRGFVKGLRFMESLHTSITVMDLNDTTFVAQFTADPRTGAFTAKVPKGRDYAVVVSAEGHLIHSEHIASDTKEEEPSMDITLQPLEAGQQEVLHNVFFPNDRSDLDPASRVELRQLVQLLKENPSLRLEVSGHTDNVIGRIDNQQLSAARAQAVVNFLVANGIAASRLQGKGYGDTRPLVPNDSDEHRAMNRRTEIRVL